MINTDNEQDLAAKHIDSHSLIIAGAGCGKTTTLFKKINFLIDSGIDEKDILVISFTNETVNNFKNKCNKNVDVFTFHKLALKYIDNNEFDIAIDNLLDKKINDVLEGLSLKLKRKLYRIFKGIIGIFSIKKYSDLINNTDSNSINSYFKSIINIINAENIEILKLNTKKLSKSEIIILYVIKIIQESYINVKKENSMIDYDDMIKIATNNINNDKYKCSYKHILVDEYQDISKIRLEFLKSILKSSSGILTAVGDDFQSIYGFSGSNIKLLYDFQKYFINSKIFYITKTYRCPQHIVNVAGKFIMKNSYQIKKNLISNNHINSKINKLYYIDKKKEFKKLINNIILKNKTTLILSRNTFDIYEYIDKDVQVKNSYIIYKNKTYDNIRFLTIHKSKGLEADIVVILNLSNNKNGFPSRKKNILINKILPTDEKVMYPEERRLFYVALTRTKEELYLFIDLNNPSVFVKEV